MAFLKDIKNFVKLVTGPAAENEPPLDPATFRPTKLRNIDTDRADALRLLNSEDIYWKTPRTTPLPPNLDAELTLLFANYEEIQTKENASIFLNLDRATEFDAVREHSLEPIGIVEFHGALFFDKLPHLYGAVWEHFEGDPGPRMESAYYESIWHFLLERDARYTKMIEDES